VDDFPVPTATPPPAKTSNGNDAAPVQVYPASAAGRVRRCLRRFEVPPGSRAGRKLLKRLADALLHRLRQVGELCRELRKEQAATSTTSGVVFSGYVIHG